MLWLILAHLLKPSPVTEAAMTELILVTDDTSRADLEEAMANIVNTLHRMPNHWTDRRASLHHKLDALLTDWQNAPA